MPTTPPSGLLYLPLCETKELDVIILQPLRVSLTKRFAVYLLVMLDQSPYPVTLVARVARIGWIAQDAKDRSLLLDGSCQAGFLGQGGKAGQQALFQFLPVQGIGEIEGNTLVVGETVAEFLQQKTHLEVANRVRRHHQLKGTKILQDVAANELLLCRRHHTWSRTRQRPAGQRWRQMSWFPPPDRARSRYPRPDRPAHRIPTGEACAGNEQCSPPPARACSRLPAAPARPGSYCSRKVS